MVFTGSNINKNLSTGNYPSPTEPLSVVLDVGEEVLSRKELFMTNNQINYWTLQESKRHNVVTEGETGRHNVVTEQEASRHNLATEGEAQRHNVAGETETNRHNIASERIDISKLAEINRHNLRTESQTDVDLAEKQRHNQMQESIDVSKLNETSRHNAALEQLEGTNLSIDAGRLQEQIRHNVASEGLQDAANEAEAVYKQNKTDIERFVSVNSAQLTADQRAEIQRRMRKMDQDYDLAVRDQKLNQYRTFVNTYTDQQKLLGNLVGSLLRGANILK